MTSYRYTEELEEYLVELRRYFHQNAEVSFKEFKTAEKIEMELDKLDIEHRRVKATGVVAKISNIKNSETAKTIVLRADIDGLPINEANNVSYKSQNQGTMHACGHDAHTASLLGAAKVLKENIETLNGSVIFIFQMAEEVGGGAKLFIEEGLLDNAYRVLGIHVASYLDSGTIGIRRGESNASCDYFKIKVKGKASHISRPQDGVDALYIGSQIVNAISSITSRNLDPRETSLIGIGKMTAGTNYNIVAAEAILEGTTRSFNEKVRKFINDKVVSISKVIAESFGAEAEVEFKDYASPLVNDLEVCDEVYDVASKIVPKEKIIDNLKKDLSADDFAEYLKCTKGNFIMVGTGGRDYTSYPHHNERFDIDEKALIVCTKIYSEYVKKIIG